MKTPIRHLIRNVSIAVGCSAMLWNPGVSATATDTLPSIHEIHYAQVLPDQQAFAYRNSDRYFPTRIVNRGLRVYPLPPSDRMLNPKSLKISDGEKTMSFYDYMSLARVSGLLVLKDGKVAFEDYELGMTEASRWISMSVVKSITSTLIGAAIRDGHIKSIDDKLVRYLPELTGSAYDGVTVKHLLLMASGVKWREQVTDSNSERGKMFDLQLGENPGTILKFMASLPRAGEPGSVWNYSTGEAQVAGALVRAAVGKPVAEYLSEKIWAKFGMERDTTWWLDSPNGMEMGGTGLSATLRDYGRFGLFFMRGGMAGGEKVLPDGWMTEAGSPHEIGGKLIPYGYLWWPAVNKGAIHEGAFAAAGSFGQFVYINPKEKLVIVHLSAQSKQVPPIPFEFFGVIAEALR